MRHALVRQCSLALTALSLTFACGGSVLESSGSGASSATAGSADHVSGGSGGSAATSGGSSGASSGGFSGTAAGGSSGTSSGGFSGTVAGSVGIGGVGGTVTTGGSGGAGALANCVPGDSCVLEPTNCCGYCLQVDISAYTAINSTRINDWMQAFCNPGPPCVACVGPYYDNTANYTAVCRDGLCRAIDVRTDELSACTANRDCRLRWGAECCEQCSGTGSALTAVSTLVSFEQAVCGATVDCPICTIPPYPGQAIAVCVSGHCRAAYPP